jgi:MFS family permease
MSTLTLLALVGFFLFMSSGIINPIGSLYYEHLGANYVAIGTLSMLASLTGITTSYGWGWLSDRVAGRKVFVVGGLVALAVSYTLMAVAPGYCYLYPLKIVEATARAAYGTASLAWIGDVLAQRTAHRGRSMGILRGLGSLGFGMTAFVSGSIADLTSLRVPFGLAGLLAGLAMLMALRAREADQVPDAQGSGRTSRVAAWLRKRVAPLASTLRGLFSRLPSAQTAVQRDGRLPLFPLLASAFIWSLGTGAVYALWANYMVGDVGYTRGTMSRLWALASLSELPLMILAGSLSDRMGRLAMLSMSFVAWTLVFAGYIVAPGMPWIIGIQLLRGFAYSGFTATAMIYAAEARGEAQRGHVSGLYSTAGGVGSVLGASAGGFLAQYGGFHLMMGFSAALIFAGALYTGACLPSRRACRAQCR